MEKGHSANGTNDTRTRLIYQDLGRTISGHFYQNGTRKGVSVRQDRKSVSRILYAITLAYGVTDK